MENRRDQVFECIRPTNCRGGVTGTISRFWRLYASGPNAWCEFGYPVHRKVSQSGKYRSQEVAGTAGRLPLSVRWQRGTHESFAVVRVLSPRRTLNHPTPTATIIRQKDRNAPHVSC